MDELELYQRLRAGSCSLRGSQASTPTATARVLSQTLPDLPMNLDHTLRQRRSNKVVPH